MNLKKLIASCILIMCIISSSAQASQTWSPQTPVAVKTYTKKDGKTVHSHYRAKPGKGCGGHGCK